MKSVFNSYSITDRHTDTCSRTHYHVAAFAFIPPYGSNFIGGGRASGQINKSLYCLLLQAVDLFRLEMSGNIFFNLIPSHSQWFIPIPNPMFSLVLFPFPSHSH